MKYFVRQVYVEVEIVSGDGAKIAAAINVSIVSERRSTYTKQVSLGK